MENIIYNIILNCDFVNLYDQFNFFLRGEFTHFFHAKLGFDICFMSNPLCPFSIHT